MANSFIDLYRKSLADQGLTDDTPDRILTKEFGDIVSKENPDLFNKFTDFAQQWADIREANAPSIAGEFGNAVAQSTKSLGSTALGGASLLTGSETLKDAAQSLDKSAGENAPTIDSLDDIAPGQTGIGKVFSRDALRYGVAKLGQAVPSLVEAVGTGLIGAAAGSTAAPGVGTVAGAGAGFFGRQLVKQSIRQLLRKGAVEGAESVAESMLSKGLIREATEAGIEDAIRRGVPQVAELVVAQAKSNASRLGAGAANTLNSYLLNAGEIYNETPDRGLALGLGAISAVPDTILPSIVLKRVFPGVAASEAREMAKPYIAKLAKEALTTVGVEGSTEGFQEAVNIVARNINANRPPLDFDQADIKRMREAAIGGAAGGLLAAPAAAYEGSRTTVEEPTPEPTQSVITPGAPIIPQQTPAQPITPAPTTQSVSKQVAVMPPEEQAHRLAELRQIPSLSPTEQQEFDMLKAFVPTEEQAPITQIEEVKQQPSAVPFEATSQPISEDDDFVYTIQDFGTGAKSIQLDRRSAADQIRQGDDAPWANNPAGWRDQGFKTPDAPAWLPQGQYTLAEIKQAIKDGPPPSQVSGPKPAAIEPAGANPESEDIAKPEVIKKPKALRDLEKLALKNNVEMKVIPYSDDTLHLFHIYVDPENRRMGKGEQALKSLIAYSEAEGKPITLTAIPEEAGGQDRLNRFYEQAGFTQTGIDPTTKSPQYIYDPSSRQAENQAKAEADQLGEHSELPDSIVKIQARVAKTGELVDVEMPANKAGKMMLSRLAILEKLANCIGS